MTSVESTPATIAEPNIRYGRAWFIEDVDMQFKLSSCSMQANKNINTMMKNIETGGIKERNARMQEIMVSEEKKLRLKENAILKRHGKPEKPIEPDKEPEIIEEPKV